MRWFIILAYELLSNRFIDQAELIAAFWSLIYVLILLIDWLKEVDLGAAALTKNDDRRNIVDFSIAFLSTKLQLLTHKNRTHLQKISDLALPYE